MPLFNYPLREALWPEKRQRAHVVLSLLVTIAILAAVASALVTTADSVVGLLVLAGYAGTLSFGLTLLLLKSPARDFELERQQRQLVENARAQSLLG